jgi:hypothetical protein
MVKISEGNFLIQQLIADWKNVAPGCIHECPYSSLVLANVSASSNSFFLNVLPSGDYKFFGSLSVIEGGSTVASGTSEFTMKSPKDLIG